MSENKKSTGLQLDQIEISLNSSPLVTISQFVAPGEVLAVMGPSGSGKSTLLAYVGGFLDKAFVAKGRILLDGQDVTKFEPEQRHLGLMFQEPLLFPHLSVGRNLMFGIPAQVSKRADRLAQVESALVEADLEGYFHRDPATLSGGQQARVALMRLLLSRPKALLLDEPFSRLDVELREKIRHFVFKQARENALPVLLVTHDEDDAKSANAKRFYIK